MAAPYTEDQLLEQLVIRLLTKLGWATVVAIQEVRAPLGTQGRRREGV